MIFFIETLLKALAPVLIIMGCLFASVQYISAYAVPKEKELISEYKELKAEYNNSKDITYGN